MWRSLTRGAAPWLAAAVLVALAPGAASPTSSTPTSSTPTSSTPTGSVPSDDPDSGVELIGQPAPSWSFTRWVRGPRRTLADYRGKVVLVRWWTEGCHFCRTTLPVLESLEHQHASDLVVIGVFHPKPEPHDVDDRHILGVAKELGFSGPIAFDRDWKTLNRYWLDGSPDRNWTSVSFLIDRQGVIRWVQGGGEYHPTSDPAHARCDLEYRGLEQALAAALASPPSRP